MAKKKIKKQNYKNLFKVFSKKVFGKKRVFEANKLIIALIVVAIFLGLLYFKNLYLVGIVNNKPIWRYSLTKDLIKQAGEQTFDNLVVKKLIEQNAKKQNIIISDGEIKIEIDKIRSQLKEQEQDLESILKMQGMEIEELETQIRIQKLVEAMAPKSADVTEEEIDEYLEKNKEMLPENMEIEVLRQQVKSQLESQKQSASLQNWVKKLKEEANIIKFL